MKPYLIVTGSLFGLLAVAHVAKTFAEWSRFKTDPGFIIEGPGLALVGGVIAFWAWWLLMRVPRA